MRMLLFSLGLAALAASLPCQSPKAPAPVTGKVFKREVDALLHGLRQTAHEDGSLADGTCLETARTLLLAGQSHRFYHIGDGPWIRGAVRFLFTQRREDGSFADAGGDPIQTTRFVRAAFAVIDPRGLADDARQAAAFLGRVHTPVTTSLDLRVARLRRQIGDAADLVAAMRKAGAPIAATLRRGPPRKKDGRLDTTSTLDALESLVACQIVARTPLAPSPRSGRSWLPIQQKGFDYLLTQQEHGVFGMRTPDGKRFADAGLTGLGLAALQTKPSRLRTEKEQAIIERGLTWLLEQQDDKGFFGQRNLNYTTCAAVMALSSAGDPRYKPALDKAQQFILGLQNTEQRGFLPTDRDYGSIGYGGDERGDLSNLQFALQALHETDIPADHEAFAKALAFLQRTQNLVEYNDYKAATRDPDTGEWFKVQPGNDGGSAYYPGNSPAGYIKLPDGSRIPRSYGSMTYALLKAYTLAGLPADDPRVLATVRWLGKSWTLEVNPGSDPRLPEKARYQGLFYYYMVMAQALDTARIDKLKVTHGEGAHQQTREVDWRNELAAQLGKIQRPDGSWLNARNGRWFESRALICSAYSMLALARCTAR